MTSVDASVAGYDWLFDRTGISRDFLPLLTMFLERRIQQQKLNNEIMRLAGPSSIGAAGNRRGFYSDRADHADGL